MRVMFKITLIFLLLIFTTKSIASCLGLGCSCSISATSVAFSNYNPFLTIATTATGTVSVTCSALVLGLLISYQITLSQGASANFSPRTMSNGNFNLQYNLYTASSLAQVWGDGTNGTGTISDSYLLNLSPTTLNHTVYGQIPALQTSATIGNYTDTIVASVIY